MLNVLRTATIALLMLGTASAMARDTHDRGVPWTLRRYLRDVGEHLDCSFTIEYAQAGPQTGTRPAATLPADLPDRVVEDVGDVVTVQQMKEKLEKQFLDVVVVEATRHERTYHIVDRALLKDPRYALNQNVSIQFSGMLHEFPDAIGKRVPGLSTQRTIRLPEVNVNVTNVNVSATATPVRTILTDAVPAAHVRVLWVAESTVSDREITTRVRYMAAPLDPRPPVTTP